VVLLGQADKSPYLDFILGVREPFFTCVILSPVPKEELLCIRLVNAGPYQVNVLILALVSQEYLVVFGADPRTDFRSVFY